MNALDSQKTVGQFVTERPSRSRLFERLGIDYCCGGKQPLARACHQKGFDPDEILQEIADHDALGAATEDAEWTAMSMSVLVDHIVGTHHTYLRNELPRLDRLVEKVARVHGPHSPHLFEVLKVFRGLKAELESHMLKEERVLFPMVKQLDSATEPLQFHCGSLGNPISVMEHEHDDAGAAMARLRELTHDYQAPEDACNTYRAMLDGLAELEADTHLHVHKENNLLFPEALTREAELRA